MYGELPMPLQPSCGCSLCDIEAHLLFDLTCADAIPFAELFSEQPKLLLYSSAPNLLSHLRASEANERSDDLFRELFNLSNTKPRCIESFLVLVFVPMLHHTIRLVRRQQASLAEDDIAQQTLSVLLDVLRSSEMQKRNSHYAFAVARGVKRRIFRWASRESRNAALLDHSELDALESLTNEASFERYALLRHFLHRSISKGWLTRPEMDLLVEFKLNGNTSEEFAALNGSSSNAVRQRFKRLLAKLRRIARSEDVDVPLSICRRHLH
jgi:DNA-directed RNA polymerase specialized sigma24 family protein